VANPESLGFYRMVEAARAHLTAMVHAWYENDWVGMARAARALSAVSAQVADEADIVAEREKPTPENTV
jgi:hypothetical protein